MADRRQAGFTLIELVVGLALLGLITTLLIGVLGTGLAATSQGERRAVRIEASFHAHRLLRERLEQAMPVAWLEKGRAIPVFKGKIDRLRFVAPTPPWPGIGGLALAELILTGGNLVLEEGPFGPAMREAHIANDARRTALADGIASIQLSYYGRQRRRRAAWHDNWSAGEGLPELIRLSVKDVDGRHWPDLVVRPHIAPQPR
jgi:prepilin-type N-terminal cleavage/methylation domain-containing protein